MRAGGDAPAAGGIVRAVIAWDQTLVSACIAAAAAALAYWRAAHVLRRQERLRDLRARRDALAHVLLGVDDTVTAYLSGTDTDYPQREMVELERRALQAQIHCLRDLSLQEALRDVCYPNRYDQALARIRAAVEALDREIVAGA